MKSGVSFLCIVHFQNRPAGDDGALNRYSTQYEEKLDPFTTFNKKERMRKYANLRPYDKITLNMVCVFYPQYKTYRGAAWVIKLLGLVIRTSGFDTRHWLLRLWPWASNFTSSSQCYGPASYLRGMMLLVTYCYRNQDRLWPDKLFSAQATAWQRF
jgi:hypothetical protein